MQWRISPQGFKLPIHTTTVAEKAIGGSPEEIMVSDQWGKFGNVGQLGSKDHCGPFYHAEQTRCAKPAIAGCCPWPHQDFDNTRTPVVYYRDVIHVKETVTSFYNSHLCCYMCSDCIETGLSNRGSNCSSEYHTLMSDRMQSKCCFTVREHSCGTRTEYNMQLAHGTSFENRCALQIAHMAHTYYYISASHLLHLFTGLSKFSIQAVEAISVRE